MRAGPMLACVAAALSLGLTVARDAVPRDSHGVQLPASYAKLRAKAAAGGCDPSKWKPPVDGVYATKGAVDPRKLNVHLIAHSHDDPYVEGSE